jgi:hypothetical protein
MNLYPIIATENSLEVTVDLEYVSEGGLHILAILAHPPSE